MIRTAGAPRPPGAPAKSASLAGLLRLLESTRFVQELAEVEPTFSFRHSLVQQAAYESVLFEDRRQLHRAVGATLERLYPEGRQELAEVLSQHFHRAGDLSRALEYAIQAGEWALRRFAVVEAADHFAKAIDVAGQVDLDDERLIHLYRRRGRSLELSGNYQQALSLYSDLETRGRDTNRPALELAGRLGIATLRAVPTAVVDTDTAIPLAKSALELARRHGDAASEARALWILMIASLGSAPEEAVAAGEQALALARHHNLREQLAFTLNDIQQAYALTYRGQQALAALLEARPLWEALDNLPMLADNLASSALVHLRLGDLETARHDGERSMEISGRIGNTWGQSYSRWPLATAHLVRGELGPAISRYRECISFGDQAGFVVAAVAGRAYLGLALCLAGDEMQGRAVIDEGARLWRELNEPLLQQLPAVEAWLAARAGAPGRAEKILGPLLDEKEEHLLAEDPFLLPAAVAETLLARRRYQAVLDRLDSYQVLLDRLSIRVLNPSFDLLRGRAWLGKSQPEEARRVLRRSLRHAQELGAPGGVWEAEGMLASLAVAAGEAAEARRHWTSARGHVEDIAAGLDSVGLAEAFRSRPEVGALLARAHPPGVESG